MTRSYRRGNHGDTHHGILWWVFCSPGAALLWMEYMFPSNWKNAVGAARRRNVVGIQFVYTMILYGIIALALTHLQFTDKFLGYLVGSPIRAIEALFHPFPRS